MNTIRQNALRLIPLAMLVCAGFASPPSAQAQSSIALRTYKVQVEYWFFDTDYYYWSTVFESNDFQQAQFVYGLFLLAQADGQLNQAAPHEYWRYFAVDVRMITTYHFPQFQLDPQRSDLFQAAIDP